MATRKNFLIFAGDDVVSSRRSAIRKKKEEFVFSVGKSSLGLILVALSEFGIVSVMRGQTKEELVDRLQSRFRKNSLREDKKATAKEFNEVMGFVNRPVPTFNLPLNVRGTVFQQKVWKEVRKIPFGETSTYAKIAAAIRAPRAMRAVASACTNNHFFLIIPCHRVLHTGEKVSLGPQKAPTRQQILIARELESR